MSCATYGVISNSSITTTYIGKAYVSYMRLSISKITRPNRNESPIQRTCLPENSSAENMLAWSKS